MMWVETEKKLPKIGDKVLGWYESGCIEAVSRIGDRWHKSGYFYSEHRDIPQYWTAIPPLFLPGLRLRKKSGAEWQGRVCGWYSTLLTADGYAIESECHAGSVQIYPASALEQIP